MTTESEITLYKRKHRWKSTPKLSVSDLDLAVLEQTCVCVCVCVCVRGGAHTSELQSRVAISCGVLCLKKKTH